MSTSLAVPVFVGAAAVSLGMSWLLVSSLERVGERLGLSEALLGVLAALAADAPEITAAVTALVHHEPRVGAGVVIGSNVFNLAALLGLSALVATRVRIHRHGLVLNGGVALAVTALAAALVLGAIGAVVATLLLAAVFAPYVFLLSLAPGRIRTLVPFEPLGRALAVAVREEIQDLRTDETAAKASSADVGLLAPSLAVIILGSAKEHRWGRLGPVVDDLRRASLGVHLGEANLEIVRPGLAAVGHGAAVVSETLNSNSLNVIAGIAIPGIVLTLGSASGLEVFAVWWLVGMTVVAVASTYVARGVGRVTGGAVIALYAAFAVILAAR